MLHTYWLSFVGPSGSLGVIITESASTREALSKVSSLGLNPGGEAMVIEIPDEPEAVAEVPAGRSHHPG